MCNTQYSLLFKCSHLTRNSFLIPQIALCDDSQCRGATRIVETDEDVESDLHQRSTCYRDFVKSDIYLSKLLEEALRGWNFSDHSVGGEMWVGGGGGRMFKTQPKTQSFTLVNS